jgi:DNA-binding transcriptional regulator GbsR (MarR family)
MSEQEKINDKDIFDGDDAIRDMRNKDKFFIDDNYIDTFAKLCGANSTLVYLCLCRHSNFYSQQCFPAVETISYEMGISNSSVSRGIEELLKYNIIKVEKKKQNDGTFLGNIYTLFDKSVWLIEKNKKVIKPKQLTIIKDKDAIERAKELIPYDDIKSALDVMIEAGFRTKESGEQLAEWFRLLMIDYPDRAFTKNARAWKDYITGKKLNGKKNVNYKLSFRNWVSKEYAIKNKNEWI